MSLITPNIPLIFPNLGITSFGGAVPSVGTHTTISAAGNYTAMILKARKAITIADVAFMVQTLTTNPSTVDVRIETVSAGLPSGTLWAANTNIVSGNIVATGWQTLTLTAPATIAQGDVFAIKIAWVSGNLNLGRIVNTAGNSQSLPHAVENGNKSTNRMIVAVSNGAGDYLTTDTIPCKAITSAPFNNTGTRSKGLRFQVPMPCTLLGALVLTQTNVGDYNLVLSSADGTQIFSQAVTGNQSIGTLSASGQCEQIFATSQVLSKDTTYYLSMEPTSATNVGFFTFDLNATALLDAVGGAQCFYATRTTAGSGAFTDDNTRIPTIQILLSQLDDGGVPATGGGPLIGGRLVA